MAVDEDIRAALDSQLLSWKGVSARRMFGGVAYTVDRRMFAVLMEGAVGLKLPDQLRDRALGLAGVSPFRSPSGGSFGEWVQLVLLLADDVPSVTPWLEAAFDYVGSLPASKRRRRRAVTEREGR